MSESNERSRPDLGSRRSSQQRLPFDFPLSSLAWHQQLQEQQQQVQQQQQQSAMPAQRPRSYSKRNPSPATPTRSQLQEDTFYQTLEIRLHHSVGSMSISPSCRDVVLAGRQGLIIIDLEDPWLMPRILPHMSKWEVADVQWSPYISRESWVASTSNQKLLVWNLNYTGSEAIEYVLHAHSRAISDINWSPHHPDLLATCSVDTYVHLWDLRSAKQQTLDDSGQPLRPASSFTSWNAATTQVKFNRKSEYLLASAHDKDVKIWDIRKGAIPLTSIEAHTKKIYGIDWSRQNDHDIVTCSLDQLVKYWNIHTPEQAQEVIMTNTPVWRARNTPFGNGVLTMPQRTENALYMYSRASPEKPVHAFNGHTDTVKEFVWRWKGGTATDGDDREFQLVTWSKDHNLRLWPITEDIMKSVGHEFSSKKTCYRVPSTAILPDGTPRSRSFQQVPDRDVGNHPSMTTPSASVSPLRLGRGGEHASTMAPIRTAVPGAVTSVGYDLMSNAYREQKYAINPLLWMQNVKTLGTPGELRRTTTSSENTYQTVAEEMTAVLNKYASAGVKTEKVNPSLRTCTISLHGPWSDTGVAFLRITIRFSAQYPDNSPPEFEIQKNSMMSIYYRAHMSQDLNALASSYTSQKRWCLEPCIRYLLGETLHEENEFDNGIDKTTSAGYANNNNNWNDDDSDDEIFGGPLLVGAAGLAGKLQSEKGIVVDMSSKQSADEKVPFPRLCGAVFSGNGQLVCFFSTLRVRDSNRDKKKNKRKDRRPSTDNTPTNDSSNAEYFENTYSDFYKHPRTYEQFEEYKEIAAMSRQGRNATVLVGGSVGAFGEYAYDEDPDDIDDGLTNMASLYFKPDSLALGSSIGNSKNLLYRSNKTDRITYNVSITDFSDMMPVSPGLAKEYVIPSEDPLAACEHNALVCKSHKRFDLYKVWLLASEIVRKCVPIDAPDRGNPWMPGVQDSLLSDLRQIWQRDADLVEIKSILDGGGGQNGDVMQYKLSGRTTTDAQRKKRRVRWGMHPFGRKLVNDLLDHFLGMGDVQTAAMLSCAFHSQEPVTKKSYDYKPQPQTLIRGSGPSTAYRTAAATAVNTAQLSSSYGSRGVNLLSYFWDTEKHTDDNNVTTKNTTTTTSDYNTTTVTTAKRITRPLSVIYPSTRYPSNTAPGLRRTPSSAHLVGPGLFSSTSTTLAASIVSAATPAIISDKDGKIVQSDELTIEFTNIEAFDGDRLVDNSNQQLLVQQQEHNGGGLDVVRLSYADMLYRWGLLEQRAEILKFLASTVEQQEKTNGLQVQLRCHYCGSEIVSRDRICYGCRKLRTQIRCSLCHVLVRGTVNFCFKCGHGGHSQHIREWFSKQKICPTGCGCICLFDPSSSS